MSIDFERIYVKLRGRPLGPLSNEKFVELVNRGQITRETELSIDGGVTWKLASSFKGLFENEEKASIEKPKQAQAEEKPEWYANFDGANRGPFSVEALKTWVSTGMLKADTPIWKEGLVDWTTAGVVFQDWFQHKSVTTSSNASERATNDSSNSQLATLLIRHQAWVQFSSITGLILCCFGCFGSILLFLTTVTREGDVRTKLVAVLAGFGQIAGFVFLIVMSVSLLQFANALNRFKFSQNETDLVLAVNKLNRFWFQLGVFSIITILFVFFALCISIAQLLLIDDRLDSVSTTSWFLRYGRI
jgi:hypothetical protein